MAKKEMLCLKCGYKGKPYKKLAGNGVMELFLYLCFFIPGLFYSHWRSSTATEVYPNCDDMMIPLDSPVAQKFIKELTKSP